MPPRPTITMIRRKNANLYYTLYLLFLGLPVVLFAFLLVLVSVILEYASNAVYFVANKAADMALYFKLRAMFKKETVTNGESQETSTP